MKRQAADSVCHIIGKAFISISDKPVYYSDFCPTLIEFSGIGEEGDENLFGKSIDDYGENELRTRVWLDTNIGSDQEIRKYVYTGNTEELERIVNEGIYTNVNTLETDLSEYE